MRTIYVFVFSLPILLIIASCGKLFGPNRLDGFVLDSSNGIPLDVAKVYLLEAETDGNILGGATSYYYIDSTISAPDGSFSFTYDEKDNALYGIWGYKTNYIVPAGITPCTGDREKNLYLTPQAWLMVHIFNTDPTASSDHFAINGYLTGSFNGENVDTNLVGEVPGNQHIVIYWAYGYEPTQTDTVYCPAFDTTYYELLF